jgi:galactose oxidase-like protein
MWQWHIDINRSMTTARAAHTATLLPSGTVLVAGDQDASGVATFSAELYDPNSGRWTATGSMATLITGGPLSGMVLVAGGQQRLWDLSSGSMQVCGSRNILADP